jgi:hypothetical protein
VISTWETSSKIEASEFSLSRRQDRQGRRPQVPSVGSDRVRPLHFQQIADRKPDGIDRTGCFAVGVRRALNDPCGLRPAAVTTAKEIFAPLKRATEIWEASNNLWSTQAKLSTFAWNVFRADKIPDGEKPLDDFSGEIAEATKVFHSIPTPEDKAMAFQEFLETSISKYLAQCTSAGADDTDTSAADENPEEVPDDAPGLVQVSPAPSSKP